MEFREVIKTLREDNGENQRTMAKRLGVSNGLISLWENGKTEPTLPQILKICEAYSITPNELLGIEEYCAKIQQYSSNQVNVKGNHNNVQIGNNNRK